jgi:hypothetical protein
LSRRDFETRWTADYDPEVVDILGTALRNKGRQRGGERYPMSDVWAMFGVLLRSPQGFEEMRRVLSLGPHGLTLMSRRTAERRTRELRAAYAGLLLYPEQIPELVRGMREHYGLDLDVDLDCNLIVDATSTTPDGMAVAGKPNPGFIVVLLGFQWKLSIYRGFLRSRSTCGLRRVRRWMWSGRRWRR